MTNRVALITGANKGIGYEIARQLGQQGITVLAAARSQTTADDTAIQLRSEGMDAVGVELDVTNAEHFGALADWIGTTYGRLDILVNNAGIWAEHGEYKGDALRDTFEVNTFGPYNLTQALLPLLLKSEGGRIVNQSSALGSIQLQLTDELAQRLATPAYAASKAALNMLTAYWAQQTKGTNLKVNAVHPGIVKTSMGGDKAELSAEDGAKTAVRLAVLSEEGPTGGFYYMDSELPW